MTLRSPNGRVCAKVEEGCGCGCNRWLSCGPTVVPEVR